MRSQHDKLRPGISPISWFIVSHRGPDRFSSHLPDSFLFANSDSSTLFHSAQKFPSTVFPRHLVLGINWTCLLWKSHYELKRRVNLGRIPHFEFDNLVLCPWSFQDLLLRWTFIRIHTHTYTVMRNSNRITSQDETNSNHKSFTKYFKDC